jgi:hypothetical protein
MKRRIQQKQTVFGLISITDQAVLPRNDYQKVKWPRYIHALRSTLRSHGCRTGRCLVSIRVLWSELRHGAP